MIVTLPYDRDKAVMYARKWALERNPLFVDFSDIGGNCTSFVSQCVYTGCCNMNFTRDFGWYYISGEDRAPAWSSVEYFYNFFTGAPEFVSANGGTGPFASEVSRELIQKGDVIQLSDESGDFYHTLIISEVQPNDILVCAHTNDSLDRPLSTYNYDSLRYLHIRGSRIELVGDSCFENVYNGVSLF